MSWPQHYGPGSDVGYALSVGNPEAQQNATAQGHTPDMGPHRITVYSHK